MKYLELLGKELKSKVLNDLFETYDVDVVYRYDRTNENLGDEYIAKFHELGLEFLFDSRQELSVIFIENTQYSGLNPFVLDEEGIPRFTSKNEAIAYAERLGIQISEGRAEFIGVVRDWVRFQYENYSVHYEFVESTLRMITIQRIHD